ncbi:uncharacterized protein G2W53_026509 [Senna tora]|uniref:Uncharacterized protein n=1 Tax=Senna tora TaxID=362788 RepID=A0A834TP39_9FABA|nr:uncharacterized protein G2W53_026509 [Senna tora]
MLELESSWHGRSVDHVLTYSGEEIAVGSQKPSQIRRQKTCCASKRLVGQVTEARRFTLYLRSRVELILELESSWRGRNVDLVLTYSGEETVVGSQKPSRITRQEICCASDRNTSVPDVFANPSGIDAQIGVVMAWEERGSCLNIFPRGNRGRISEPFTNYEEKHLMGKNLHELRGESLVAQVRETHRFELYLRSRVELMLELESSWRGRSVDHVLTYSGKEIAVRSQKPS